MQFLTVSHFIKNVDLFDTNYKMVTQLQDRYLADFRVSSRPTAGTMVVQINTYTQCPAMSAFCIVSARAGPTVRVRI